MRVKKYLSAAALVFLAFLSLSVAVSAATSPTAAPDADIEPGPETPGIQNTDKDVVIPKGSQNAVEDPASEFNATKDKQDIEKAKQEAKDVEAAQARLNAATTPAARAAAQSQLQKELQEKQKADAEVKKDKEHQGIVTYYDEMGQEQKCGREPGPVAMCDNSVLGNVNGGSSDGGSPAPTGGLSSSGQGEQGTQDTPQLPQNNNVNLDAFGNPTGDTPPSVDTGAPQPGTQNTETPSVEEPKSAVRQLWDSVTGKIADVVGLSAPETQPPFDDVMGEYNSFKPEATGFQSGATDAMGNEGSAPGALEKIGDLASNALGKVSDAASKIADAVTPDYFGGDSSAYNSPDGLTPPSGVYVPPASTEDVQSALREVGAAQQQLADAQNDPGFSEEQIQSLQTAYDAAKDKLTNLGVDYGKDPEMRDAAIALDAATLAKSDAAAKLAQAQQAAAEAFTGAKGDYSKFVSAQEAAAKAESIDNDPGYSVAESKQADQKALELLKQAELPADVSKEAREKVNEALGNVGAASKDLSKAIGAEQSAKTAFEEARIIDQMAREEINLQNYAKQEGARTLYDAFGREYPDRRTLAVSEFAANSAIEANQRMSELQSKLANATENLKQELQSGSQSGKALGEINAIKGQIAQEQQSIKANTALVQYLQNDPNAAAVAKQLSSPATTPEAKAANSLLQQQIVQRYDAQNELTNQQIYFENNKAAFEADQTSFTTADPNATIDALKTKMGLIDGRIQELSGSPDQYTRTTEKVIADMTGKGGLWSDIKNGLHDGLSKLGVINSASFGYDGGQVPFVVAVPAAMADALLRDVTYVMNTPVIEDMQGDLSRTTGEKFIETAKSGLGIAALVAPLPQSLNPATMFTKGFAEAFPTTVTNQTLRELALGAGDYVPNAVLKEVRNPYTGVKEYVPEGYTPKFTSDIKALEAPPLTKAPTGDYTPLPTDKSLVPYTPPSGAESIRAAEARVQAEINAAVARAGNPEIPTSPRVSEPEISPSRPVTTETPINRGNAVDIEPPSTPSQPTAPPSKFSQAFEAAQQRIETAQQRVSDFVRDPVGTLTAERPTFSVLDDLKVAPPVTNLPVVAERSAVINGNAVEVFQANPARSVSQSLDTALGRALVTELPPTGQVYIYSGTPRGGEPSGIFYSTPFQAVDYAGPDGTVTRVTVPESALPRAVSILSDEGVTAYTLDASAYNIPVSSAPAVDVADTETDTSTDSVATGPRFSYFDDPSGIVSSLLRGLVSGAPTFTPAEGIYSPAPSPTFGGVTVAPTTVIGKVTEVFSGPSIVSNPVTQYEVPQSSPIQVIRSIPVPKRETLSEVYARFQIDPQPDQTTLYSGVGQAYDPRYPNSQNYFTPNLDIAYQQAILAQVPGNTPHVVAVTVPDEILADYRAYRQLSQLDQSGYRALSDLSNSNIQIPDEWLNPNAPVTVPAPSIQGLAKKVEAEMKSYEDDLSKAIEERNKIEREVLLAEAKKKGGTVDENIIYVHERTVAAQRKVEKAAQARDTQLKTIASRVMDRLNPNQQATQLASKGSLNNAGTAAPQKRTVVANEGQKQTIFARTVAAWRALGRPQGLYSGIDITAPVNLIVAVVKDVAGAAVGGVKNIAAELTTSSVSEDLSSLSAAEILRSRASNRGVTIDIKPGVPQTPVQITAIQTTDLPRSQNAGGRNAVEVATDAMREWLEKPLITESKIATGGSLSTLERMQIRNELEANFPAANSLYESNKLRANVIAGAGSTLEQAVTALKNDASPEATALKALYNPELFKGGRAYDQLPLEEKVALVEKIDEIARSYLAIVSGEKVVTASSVATVTPVPLKRAEIGDARVAVMSELAKQSGAELSEEFLNRAWFQGTQDAPLRTSPSEIFRKMTQGTEAEQNLVRNATQGDTGPLLAEITARSRAGIPTPEALRTQLTTALSNALDKKLPTEIAYVNPSLAPLSGNPKITIVPTPRGTQGNIVRQMGAYILSVEARRILPDVLMQGKAEVRKTSDPVSGGYRVVLRDVGEAIIASGPNQELVNVIAYKDTAKKSDLPGVEGRTLVPAESETLQISASGPIDNTIADKNYLSNPTPGAPFVPPGATKAPFDELGTRGAFTPNDIVRDAALSAELRAKAMEFRERASDLGETSPRAVALESVATELDSLAEIPGRAGKPLDATEAAEIRAEANKVVASLSQPQASSVPLIEAARNNLASLVPRTITSTLRSVLGGVTLLGIQLQPLLPTPLANLVGSTPALSEELAPTTVQNTQTLSPSLIAPVASSFPVVLTNNIDGILAVANKSAKLPSEYESLRGKFSNGNPGTDAFPWPAKDDYKAKHEAVVKVTHNLWGIKWNFLNEMKTSGQFDRYFNVVKVDAQKQPIAASIVPTKINIIPSETPFVTFASYADGFATVDLKIAKQSAYANAKTFDDVVKAWVNPDDVSSYIAQAPYLKAVGVKSGTPLVREQGNFLEANQLSAWVVGKPNAEYGMFKQFEIVNPATNARVLSGADLLPLEVQRDALVKTRGETAANAWFAKAGGKATPVATPSPTPSSNVAVAPAPQKPVTIVQHAQKLAEGVSPESVQKGLAGIKTELPANKSVFEQVAAQGKGSFILPNGQLKDLPGVAFRWDGRLSGKGSLDVKVKAFVVHYQDAGKVVTPDVQQARNVISGHENKGQSYPIYITDELDAAGKVIAVVGGPVNQAGNHIRESQTEALGYTNANTIGAMCLNTGGGVGTCTARQFRALGQIYGALNAEYPGIIAVGHGDIQSKSSAPVSSWAENFFKSLGSDARVPAAAQNPEGSLEARYLNRAKNLAGLAQKIEVAGGGLAKPVVVATAPQVVQTSLPPNPSKVAVGTVAPVVEPVVAPVVAPVKTLPQRVDEALQVASGLSERPRVFPQVSVSPTAVAEYVLGSEASKKVAERFGSATSDMARWLKENVSAPAPAPVASTQPTVAPGAAPATLTYEQIVKAGSKPIATLLTDMVSTVGGIEKVPNVMRTTPQKIGELPEGISVDFVGRKDGTLYALVRQGDFADVWEYSAYGSAGKVAVEYYGGSLYTPEEFIPTAQKPVIAEAPAPVPVAAETPAPVVPDANVAKAEAKVEAVQKEIVAQKSALTDARTALTELSKIDGMATRVQNSLDAALRLKNQAQSMGATLSALTPANAAVVKMGEVIQNAETLANAIPATEKQAVQKKITELKKLRDGIASAIASYDPKGLALADSAAQVARSITTTARQPFAAAQERVKALEAQQKTLAAALQTAQTEVSAAQKAKVAVAAPAPVAPSRIAVGEVAPQATTNTRAGLNSGNVILHYQELSVEQAVKLGAKTVIRPFGTKVAELREFEAEGIEAYKYVNPLNESGPKCDGCIQALGFRTGSEGLFDIKNPAFETYLKSQVPEGVTKIFLDNSDAYMKQYGFEGVKKVVAILRSAGVEKIIINNPNLVSPEAVTLPGVVAGTFENTSKDAADAVAYIEQVNSYRKQNPQMTAIILDDNGNTAKEQAVKEAIQSGKFPNIAISISSAKDFKGNPVQGAFAIPKEVPVKQVAQSAPPVVVAPQPAPTSVQTSLIQEPPRPTPVEVARVDDAPSVETVPSRTEVTTVEPEPQAPVATDQKPSTPFPSPTDILPLAPIGVRNPAPAPTGPTPSPSLPTRIRTAFGRARTAVVDAYESLQSLRSLTSFKDGIGFESTPQTTTPVTQPVNTPANPLDRPNETLTAESDILLTPTAVPGSHGWVQLGGEVETLKDVFTALGKGLNPEFQLKRVASVAKSAERQHASSLEIETILRGSEEADILASVEKTTPFIAAEAEVARATKAAQDALERSIAANSPLTTAEQDSLLNAVSDAIRARELARTEVYGDADLWTVSEPTTKITRLREAYRSFVEDIKIAWRGDTTILPDTGIGFVIPEEQVVFISRPTEWWPSVSDPLSEQAGALMNDLRSRAEDTRAAGAVEAAALYEDAAAALANAQRLRDGGKRSASSQEVVDTLDVAEQKMSQALTSEQKSFDAYQSSEIARTLKESQVVQPKVEEVAPGAVAPKENLPAPEVSPTSPVANENTPVVRAPFGNVTPLRGGGGGNNGGGSNGSGKENTNESVGTPSRSLWTRVAAVLAVAATQVSDTPRQVCVGVGLCDTAKKDTQVATVKQNTPQVVRTSLPKTAANTPVTTRTPTAQPATENAPVVDPADAAERERTIRCGEHPCPEEAQQPLYVTSAPKSLKPASSECATLTKCIEAAEKSPASTSVGTPAKDGEGKHTVMVNGVNKPILTREGGAGKVVFTKEGEAYARSIGCGDACMSAELEGFNKTAPTAEAGPETAAPDATTETPGGAQPRTATAGVTPTQRTAVGGGIGGGSTFGSAPSGASTGASPSQAFTSPGSIASYASILKSLLGLMNSFWNATQNPTTPTTTPTQVAPLTLFLIANPGIVSSSTDSVLSWGSVGATYCVLYGPRGVIQQGPISGSIKIRVDQATQFALTCANSKEQKKTSYVVRVTGDTRDPLPARTPDSPVTTVSPQVQTTQATQAIQNLQNVLQPAPAVSTFLGVPQETAPSPCFAYQYNTALMNACLQSQQ